MTIDAARSGLRVVEVELPLVHRATRRDAAGFAHRGRQLLEAALGAGPLAENHRGNRLPLVGAVTVLGGIGAPVRTALAVGAVAAIGLADDVWSGTERGWRAHLSAGRTTGVLKLVGIPIVGGWATRSITGGVLVGLAANAVNVLDTRPGRALKAFGAASLAVRAVPPGYRAVAVMLLPYDLRERGMLGDGGSNAFGAVLGLAAVSGSSTRARLALVAGLAGLNVAAEAVSLGRLIERTPVLRELDALGRIA
jgi:hypothetical protein